MSTAREAGKGGRYLVIVAGLVTVATLFAAIRVMGTPGQQRLARLDAVRVDDLEKLVGSVRRSARVHGRMPATLQAATAGTRTRIHDHVTGEPYGYAVLGSTGFQLCAVFDTDTSKQLQPRRNYFRPPVGADWEHPVGRYCFEFPLKDVD